MRKVVEILRRFRREMGVAGSVLIVMIAFVTIPVIVYHAAGIGEVPPVNLEVVARDNAIVLVVLNGRIPAEDWEYLVFDERVNPPTTWVSAPTDMEPGENILLGSDLLPATYRVQVRHKPTLKFIFETKVTVGG
jgi:hypothetical protein